MFASKGKTIKHYDRFENYELARENYNRRIKRLKKRRREEWWRKINQPGGEEPTVIEYVSFAVCFYGVIFIMIFLA